MRLTTFALSAALASVALPLSATSFVMVPDEDLADQAAAVVEARVLSVDDAPVDTPSTDYLIEVERVLKGSIPGSNLIVRVPGGTRPDGVSVKIWGAPAFHPGERPVLFLVPSDDGAYRVLHLMLGAFHDAVVDRKRALVRDLSEAAEVAMPGEPEGARARFHQPRDRAKFVAWLVDRALGDRRGEDYFLTAPDGTVPAVDRYSFFEFNGFKLRWFEFDSGSHEAFRVLASGQPGLTPQQTVDAFKAGLHAWNADSATNIDYVYEGTTSTVGGSLDNPDGHNSIVFEDPTNYIHDPFDCEHGGTLAVGGVFPTGTGTKERTPGGERFKPISEGDIVTNRGIECFFNSSLNKTKAAEELFGHELGHTLGLGHSCDDPQYPCDHQALMFPFIHDDGRGARLTADDRAAIFTLYGIGTVPAAPSNLQAEILSASQVRLTWSDNSSNETAFRVEWKPPGSSSYQLKASLAANSTEYLVTGLTENSTYSFRVKASNGIGTSGASNVVTLDAEPPPPAAPSDLTAAPVSSTSIRLDWHDNSTNETGFAIEERSPLNEYQVIQITGPGVSGVTVTGLATGVPATFRVQARTATGASAYSDEATATPVAPGPSTCVPADDTLCLLDDRFQVRVQWRNQHSSGEHGIGHAAPFPGSQKTGTFWFFNDANVELIVKALDGETVNGNFWLFYGALSDVEYWLTVVDTATGGSKTYHNQPGELCGVPDTGAFPGDPSPAVGPAPPPAASSATAVGQDVSSPCQADAQTLCLLDGRFQVRVEWTDQRTGHQGVGTAIPGTEKSGYFWFFNAQNIELVVKALDNRVNAGNFWFFYGALSDVVYTVTVRDTVTDMVKFYSNPAGGFCGKADTVGFPDSL